MTTAPTSSDLAAQLAAELRGRVVTTTDAAYDAIRRVAEGSADLRPSLIARGYSRGFTSATIAVGSLITATIPPITACGWRRPPSTTTACAASSPTCGRFNSSARR